MPVLVINAGLMPNLLAHVYACLNVFPTPRYKCGDRVVSSYARLLGHALEHDFKTRPPLAGGPLFTLLFQIPASMKAENIDEVVEVFNTVKKVLERGSLEPLKKALGSYMVEEWFPSTDFLFENIEADTEKLHHLLDLVAWLAIRSYKQYYSGKWPEVASHINRLGEKLLGILGGVDVIGLWENILCTKFPFNSFIVYPCEACGTISSLVGNAIVIPLEGSIKDLVNAIVHEVGVHFFTPRRLLGVTTLREHYAGNQYALLRFVEALVCYHKQRILDVLGIEIGQDIFEIGMNLSKEIKVIEKLAPRYRCDSMELLAKATAGI